MILNFNGGENARFTKYIHNQKRNNILYNNKEIRKFFICEDIDDNNQDKELLRTIQVKMNIILIFRI